MDAPAVVLLALRPVCLAKARAFELLGIDEDWSRKYNTVLSFSFVFVYTALLYVTIIAPAAIVNAVSLIGLDDISVDSLNITGFGNHAIHMAGQYQIRCALPTTVRYGPLAMKLSYIVPKTKRIKRLGVFYVDAFRIDPSMSDPEAGTVTIRLPNLEYEYVKGNGYEFYEYSRHSNLVMIAQADIVGEMHMGGGFWMPMSYRLDWAYGSEQGRHSRSSLSRAPLSLSFFRLQTSEGWHSERCFDERSSLFKGSRRGDLCLCRTSPNRLRSLVLSTQTFERERSSTCVDPGYNEILDYSQERFLNKPLKKRTQHIWPDG